MSPEPSFRARTRPCRFPGHVGSDQRGVLHRVSLEVRAELHGHRPRRTRRRAAPRGPSTASVVLLMTSGSSTSGGRSPRRRALLLPPGRLAAHPAQAARAVRSRDAKLAPQRGLADVRDIPTVRRRRGQDLIGPSPTPHSALTGEGAGSRDSPSCMTKERRACQRARRSSRERDGATPTEQGGTAGSRT